MSSPFLPELVNGPFGDPGLYVGLPRSGNAILFDLGNLDRFPATKIHKVSHILVSHTHIDHFVGFDRVLRLLLGRDTLVKLYGPPGIIENVHGKIRGYTWNLIDGYPLVFEVFEVHQTEILGARLSAATAFSVEKLGREPFSGVLCEQPDFAIRAEHLNHRIPSMAFAVQAPRHINIRKADLEHNGYRPGAWLEALKVALRAGASPDTLLMAERRGPDEAVRSCAIGELCEQFVDQKPGEKLAYVVDAGFTAPNVDRIVELIREADIFFCESPFVDDDREHAKSRYHLTARQAGTLARLANVKQLRTFHFSPRYNGQAARLITEAEAAYRGELPSDEPY